jgi:hypothetical protein
MSADIYGRQEKYNKQLLIFGLNYPPALKKSIILYLFYISLCINQRLGYRSKDIYRINRECYELILYFSVLQSIALSIYFIHLCDSIEASSYYS